MAGSLKIRAHEIDGQVIVKSVINHPMETGKRKVKKTGKKIPSHFIKEVIVSENVITDNESPLIVYENAVQTG